MGAWMDIFRWCKRWAGFGAGIVFDDDLAIDGRIIIYTSAHTKRVVYWRGNP